MITLVTDIRAQRNALLAQSDWTQLPDANMSQERKQAWADYRQALRDITDDATVVWPDVPGKVPDAPSTGSRFGNLLSHVASGQ